MFENFIFVWGIGEFAGEILAGEVQKFMYARPPFGAVGHVVDNSIVSDPHAREAFACVAA